MTLITDGYREQNRALHATRDDYGVGGKKWANMVSDIAGQQGIKDVLDYGCGKGTLAKTLPLLNVAGYDPAVEGFDGPPVESELVVCTDVLEHVEPELLDNVLDDIKRLATRFVILVVATRPAVKHLNDGRNAHLTVEAVDWWMPKLMARFDLVQANNMGGQEFVFVGGAK